MLVGSKVIDNAIAFFAVDHVRVETTLTVSLKRPNPGHSLPPQGIDVGVVLDLESHVTTAIRKHDPPPRTHIKERQRIKRSVPDHLHDSATYASDPISAGETKATLNLRMKPGEIRTEGTLID